MALAHRLSRCFPHRRPADIRMRRSCGEHSHSRRGNPTDVADAGAALGGTGRHTARSVLGRRRSVTGAAGVNAVRRGGTRRQRFQRQLRRQESRRHATGAPRSVPRRRPRLSCRASCGGSAITSRRSITCRRGRSTGPQQARRESEARFRPKLPTLTAGEVWKWADNPFRGAREFRGLLVVLLMLNSTDLKDTNNSDLRREGGRGRRPRAGFSSATSAPRSARPASSFHAATGSKDSRRSGFITRVSGQQVEFDYRRPASGTADDDHARRTCSGRRSGCSGSPTQQWRDAFRAGNYAEPSPTATSRRIKTKIADGLALRASPGAAS